MEKGIDSYLKEQFEIPDVDIRTYSPLTLAYIGEYVRMSTSAHIHR